MKVNYLKYEFTKLGGILVTTILQGGRAYITEDRPTESGNTLVMLERSQLTLAETALLQEAVVSNDAPVGSESHDFARLDARIKALEDRNTLADKASAEANDLFISMYKAQIISFQTRHEPPANLPCQ